jgi:pyroglutamyl-peptidase
MRTVLLTGFDPFDGAAWNPSGDAALRLHGRTLGDARITSARLPVLWDVAGRALLARIAETSPRAVLCLGMAHDTFRVERFADDRRVARPDDDGVIPAARAATVRLAARLPVARMEAAIRAVVGDARVAPSEDAGGFLCNEVFCMLMRAADAHGLERAGFLHVPSDRFVPGKIGDELLDEAVLAAVRAMIEDLASPTPA